MCFFFFNDTATTEIYTLSLHDALPISQGSCYRPSACRTSFATRRALAIAPWTVAFWPSDCVASPAKNSVASSGAPNSSPARLPPTAAYLQPPRGNGPPSHSHLNPPRTPSSLPTPP